MARVLATLSARSEALRLRLSMLDRTTLAGGPDFLGRPKRRYRSWMVVPGQSAPAPGLYRPNAHDDGEHGPSDEEIREVFHVELR